MSKHSYDMSTVKLEDAEKNSLQLTQEEKLSGKKCDYRGKWSKGREFLLSCISMSVGLGNVWRFPYVAYENGGGAFLIPYLLLLLIVGRPLYYLEMVLGQFSSQGLIKVWKCVPALKGLGFAQLISTGYVIIYYNYIMALTLYYFFASFQYPLPWTVCNENWPDCAIKTHSVNNLNQSSFDGTYSFTNETVITSTTTNNKQFSQMYYERDVLNKSSGLAELTSINWKLAACLALSWILVYFTICKGIKSVGKVVYFTSLFPYGVLISILAVTLLNDGAVDGIIYFFKPKWSRLLDPIVWYKAVEQSFWSLNACFGSIIMYSSYNQFRNNVQRDALIISFMDTFTSVLAGSVIFAVLGSMAFKAKVPMESVIGDGGPGLAFIAYPEALSAFKFLPQLWSALFFLMLFTLGIGSTVADIETILTAIKDEYIILHKKKHYVALVACVVFFLCGLPLTTNAGTYIQELLDNYGVGPAIFIYAIIEVVGITWIYGYQRFSGDIEFMLKEVPSLFWRITWTFATPATLVVIAVYGNYEMFSGASTNPGIPLWGTIIGAILAVIAVFQIPMWMVAVIMKYPGSLKQRIQRAFTAKPDWGPKDPLVYQEYITWKNYEKESKESESYHVNPIFKY